MTTIDLEDHLAQLYAHRSQFEAGLAALDQRISAIQDFIALLETPLPVPPDTVTSASDRPSQSAGETRRSSAARGPKAADHPAVSALRADDLRPFQRHKQDLVSLALRYAELHDGEVPMGFFVPIAIRVGLCRAETYKNGWSSVYRALDRRAEFVRAGKGRFVVSPVTAEAAEADVA